MVTGRTNRGAVAAPATDASEDSNTGNFAFFTREHRPADCCSAGNRQQTCRRLFYWSLNELPVPAAIQRAARAVQAELCTVRDLSLLVAATTKDCVVLDVDQLAVPVFNHLRRMRYESIHAVLMIIAGSVDLDASIEAVRSGAWHVFSKPVDEAHFTKYLSKAMTGEDPHRRWLVEYHQLRQQWESLTLRERQTVELLVSGLSNKQIAARLGLTVRAVELRRASAMRKLAMDSTAELFRLVLRLRWLIELLQLGT